MSATTEATRPSSAEASGELACISYLRGLAALGVVLLHVREFLWVGLKQLQAQPALGGRSAHLEAYLSYPAPFMGSGVMLFFVISGFCIHLPYAIVKGRPLAWKEYAARRFFRIYPPYLAALLIAVVVEIIGTATGAFAGINKTIDLAAVFMLQNALGQQPVANDALWTLPIEVSYYFLYPLIYLGFRTISGRGTLALCGLISIIDIELNLARGTLFSFSFVPYWAVWTSGAVLAEFYARGAMRKPSVGAYLFGLLALVFAMHATYLRRSDDSTVLDATTQAILTLESFSYGCFFAIFLWWSLTHLRVYARVPQLLGRALDFLGTLSYSLYLVHIPFFICCAWIWMRIFHHKPVHFLVSCGFVLLAVLAAWILYRLVEAPSHELGRRVARYYKPKSLGTAKTAVLKSGADASPAP